MLDTIISPNHHAYQFRVDILPNPSFAKDLSGNLNQLQQRYMERICDMLADEEFVDWIVSFETSPSGKHHYQSIIWHSHLLSTKERNRMKSKWFRTNRDSKNAISFTTAKKIINLSSYVFKDHQEFQQVVQQPIINHNLFYTSLSWDQIKLIPEWLTREKMKAQFKTELEEHILFIISEDEYGHRPTVLSTATAIVKFYIQHDHAPPSRYLLYKLLLRYHPAYTPQNYLYDIGFINQDYPNYTPQIDSI